MTNQGRFIFGWILVICLGLAILFSLYGLLYKRRKERRVYSIMFLISIFSLIFVSNSF